MMLGSVTTLSSNTTGDENVCNARWAAMNALRHKQKAHLAVYCVRVFGFWPHIVEQLSSDRLGRLVENKWYTVALVGCIYCVNRLHNFNTLRAYQFRNIQRQIFVCPL